MKFTPNRIVVVTTLLIVVACSFAIYLRLFTQKELWYEMFAAVLGVVITAVITMILLRGQTDNDVKREKESKVFEEKLRIYQEFLQTLFNVIKDGSLSDEEKIELEFQTSYVAMHCTPQYIVSVSCAIKKIIAHTCAETGDSTMSGSKSNSPEPLLENLFAVVEAFRKDLYGDKFEFDNLCKQATLRNFSEAYRDAREEKTPDPQANNCEAADTTRAAGPDRTLWDAAVRRWASEGWEVNGLQEADDWFAISQPEGNPGRIELGLHEERYYIKAAYLDHMDFAKPLKWEKRGKRTYGTWWAYLPEPYASIPAGTFGERFSCDKELQRYIIDTVDELKDYLARYHRTVAWKDGVGAYTDWNIFIWYWDMLACQYENEAEGTPYMDIVEDKNTGHVLIQLGNRQGDEKKLQETLKRIGCAHLRAQESGYVLLEEVQSVRAEDVARSVKQWIERINHHEPK